jgi:hypothetical protein
MDSRLRGNDMDNYHFQLRKIHICPLPRRRGNRLKLAYHTGDSPPTPCLIHFQGGTEICALALLL